MKSRLVRSLFLTALLSLAAGCATPELQTPSGRPEVLVVHTAPPEVLRRAVLQFARLGEQVKTTTPYSVTFAKKSADFGEILAFGSLLNSTPERRTTVTVVPVGTATQVYAVRELVTNPGSAYESSVDFTRQAGPELQQLLDRLKSN